VHRRIRWLGALVAGATVATTCASPADDELSDDLAPPEVVYVHDSAGRLRAVTDPDGDTAVYRYDAVGNILEIDRFDSDVSTVIAVVPEQAASGDEVVVHGTGFAGDPDDNVVEVGGVAAEVVAAGEFALTIVVPDGVEGDDAAVSVETPDGHAAGDVAVAATSEGRPRVEGFSPIVVAPGGAVTIDGRGFSPDPLLDAVRVGDTYATVREATETQLVVDVPATATGDGRAGVGRDGRRVGRRRRRAVRGPRSVHAG
jgi:YD repeat-containing protein